MTDTLALLRGRQVVVPLENQSGGALALGDVVIFDDGNDKAVTTVAQEGYADDNIGVVVDDAIANGATGRIQFYGYCEQINLDGAANRGDWIKTDAVAGDGTPVANPDTGCFAQALEAGASPACFLLGAPLQAATGAAPSDVAYWTFGTDADLSAEVDVSDFILHNLIKNSPGQIVTDGSEPQWWDESGANATLTDEDAAGEGIADKFERVFKLVTTADNEYGYQAFTFADEELLDAGVTEVSLAVWVYCAAANTASVGINGANLGLEESDQHTGGGDWELLTVEGVTLDAADASIDVRLICDTGTAYFGRMALVVGPKAVMLKPRGLKPIPLGVTHFDLNTTGDVAWSDTDCTANTDLLAVAMFFRMDIQEADGAAGSYFEMGHNEDLLGGDESIARAYSEVTGNFNSICAGEVMGDDGQVVRYGVSEVDADADVRARCRLCGYLMWE